MSNELQKTTELEALATEINNAHQEVNNQFKYTLNNAIYAGEKLIEAKAKCEHGEWLPWFDGNIGFSRKTGDIYRTLSMNKGMLLSNSQEITNLSIEAAMRLITGGTPMLQSMSNEWYTPQEYIDAVYEVMGGIDLDPASSYRANETVKASEFYAEEDDGLFQSWGGRVFLNPPYGKSGPAFIRKLVDELDNTVTEAIVLVNSRATDAEWFQDMFDGIICFTDHRIDFDSPEEKNTSSTHGSCFIYFGPNRAKFADVFGRFGNVVKRY